MQMDENEVLSLVKTHYPSLPTKSASKNPGYSPTKSNFLITLSNTDRDSTTSRCLAKVSEGWNELESIKMQHNYLYQLISKGIPVPEPVISEKGETCLKCNLAGRKCILQILTYVGGRTVNQSLQNSSELFEICYDMGQLLAKFHVATTDFQCTPVPLDRENMFICGNGRVITEYMDIVEDAYLRDSLEKHFQSCQNNLWPRLSELRQGFIHGDFSDTNVIVKCFESATSKKKWKITGVIDFEDCGYQPLVGDLGICIAYMMMKSVSLPQSDPIEHARMIILGYQSITPMTQEEKDTLIEFVLERLIVSYVMGRCYLQKNPDNEETILLQSQHIPALLSIIDSTKKSTTVDRLFEK